MIESDQNPHAEVDASPSVRITSVVAQLRAEEMHRQARGAPYPLASLTRIEHQLSDAIARGEGLGNADVLKLQTALGDHRQKCETQLKRSSRVGGLWSELLDLLWKRER